MDGILIARHATVDFIWLKTKKNSRVADRSLSNIKDKLFFTFKSVPQIVPDSKRTVFELYLKQD